MKILSLFVLRVAGPSADPIPLAKAFYLDDYSFFQKDSARQFATFASKTVARRVEAGQRSTVEHEGLLVHVHVRASGAATVAVCDREYPARVAYTLLMKVHDDFMAEHERAWETATGELPFAGLEAMIRKYQNPTEADSIMRIQKDLDETKIILHKTIDSVLERGVKLDNLVEKSTDLSAQSKMFYRVRFGTVEFARFFRIVFLTFLLFGSMVDCEKAKQLLRHGVASFFFVSIKY